MQTYHHSGYNRKYSQDVSQFSELLDQPTGMNVVLPAGGRFLIRGDGSTAGAKVATANTQSLFPRTAEGLVLDWMERFTTITL